MQHTPSTSPRADDLASSSAGSSRSGSSRSGDDASSRDSRPPFAPRDGMMFGAGSDERDEAVDDSGLHDGDQEHVASWLHLSLGFETG